MKTANMTPRPATVTKPPPCARRAFAAPVAWIGVAVEELLPLAVADAFADAVADAEPFPDEVAFPVAEAAADALLEAPVALAAPELLVPFAAAATPFPPLRAK
jgi:hypothetical protein